MGLEDKTKGLTKEQKTKVGGLRNYLIEHPKVKNGIIYGSIATLLTGAVGFYALDRWFEKNFNFKGEIEAMEFIMKMDLHPEDRDTND